MNKIKWVAIMEKWNEVGCFKERHYIEAESFQEAFCKTKDWFVAGWNIVKIREV